MKFSFPLYVQILSLLFLYLGVLALINFICFNAQFGIGWEALLKSPVGDRVDAVADAINAELSASSAKKWNDVLNHFRQTYHANFYVFDIGGQQLAGEPITLPQTVSDRVAVFTAPKFGLFTMAMPPEMVMSGRLMVPPPNGGRPPMPPMPARTVMPGLPVMSAMPALPVMPAIQPMPSFSVSRVPTAPFVFGMAGKPIHTGFMMHTQTISSTMPTFNMGRPILPMTIPFPTSAQSASGVLRDPRFPRLNAHAEALHAQGRFMLHSNNPDRFWIGTKFALSSSEFPHHIPAVLLAESSNLWRTKLLFDFQFAALILAIVIGLSIVFWWPFIHHLTTALSRLTAASEKMAEGQFDVRLPKYRSNELGRLAEAVNRMAERLGIFVSGQRRFLGDISHELFSPIARLQVAIALLEESVGKEHQPLLEDIREEVEEMNNLVHELLAYSKAGLVSKELELSSINIAALGDEVVSRLNMAKEVEIEVSTELCASGDPLLLSRAVSNILRNSARYAANCGPISIKASAQGALVYLIIDDNGPGVPEEALKHMTEPFFRPEPSRSRSSGGVGLGLAIVKSCIEACKGTVHLRNRPEGGLQVEMRLQPSPQNNQPKNS